MARLRRGRERGQVPILDNGGGSKYLSPVGVNLNVHNSGLSAQAPRNVTMHDFFNSSQTDSDSAIDSDSGITNGSGTVMACTLNLDKP